MEYGLMLRERDQEGKKYQMELPPGFRFHPTDEELVAYYLSMKAMDSKFDPLTIAEVDLNKFEPWDLPWKAKMGEKEWYFFCLKDKKYPTGMRTNRATEQGYWKATGKDKEIKKDKLLVGMKKTLVFYRGRAPRGEKTSWVMHEYRLVGKGAILHLSRTEQNEWVLCRVFNKSPSNEKRDTGFGSSTSLLQTPLLDSFSNSTAAWEDSSSKDSPLPPEVRHVTCFSKSAMDAAQRFYNQVMAVEGLEHLHPSPRQILSTPSNPTGFHHFPPSAMKLASSDHLAAIDTASHGLGNCDSPNTISSACGMNHGTDHIGTVVQKYFHQEPSSTCTDENLIALNDYSWDF